MSLFKHLDKRKIIVSALISTLLFSALAGSLFVNLAVANPDVILGSPSPPSVRVSLDAHNLTITIAVRADSLRTARGFYVNPSFSPIQVWVDRTLWTELPGGQGSIQISLRELSDGWHKVHVTVVASWNSYSSKGSSNTIEVLIDNSQPVLSTLSVAQVAARSDVQVNFQVMDLSLSWLGYSLDGEENVTVDQEVLFESSLGSSAKVWTGNLMLAGLSSGLHSLVVYAEDQFGSTGASNIKEFMVGESLLEEAVVIEETQPALLPTWIAIAIIVSTAIVSFGLVAYFIKRSRKRSK